VGVHRAGRSSFIETSGDRPSVGGVIRKVAKMKTLDVEGHKQDKTERR